MHFSENRNVVSYFFIFKDNKTMDVHLYFNFDLSKNYLQILESLTKNFLAKLETNNQFWPPFFFIRTTNKSQKKCVKRTPLMVAHYIYSNNRNPNRWCCSMNSESFNKMVATFKSKEKTRNLMPQFHS